MDRIGNPRCKPHPLAESLLFKHKRDVLAVFNRMIGRYELAHLSIACINQANEVLFLSHTPSIEYHLMASELWKDDLSLDPLFYKNHQSKLWDELYAKDKYYELHHLKQAKNQFSSGFSIPLKRNGFYLIYSFATKARHINPYLFFFDKQSVLITIGNYCFNQLKPVVLPALFNKKQQHIESSKHLRLIANKSTNYTY
jgi:hypothetical protein